MRTRKQMRGFTLIEVMLVLVILGGLAALAVTTLGGSEDKSKIEITKTKMNFALSRIGLYKVAVGEYPSDDDGLNALVTKPDFDNESKGEGWYELLKAADLKDAWGNELRYELGEDDKGKATPKVMSNGPDGDEDTDDDITLPSDEKE